MHWRKLRDERFLGSWDFDPDLQKTPLTITAVGPDKVHRMEDNTEERVPVMRFDGLPGELAGKAMVLNATNCKTMETMYGPDVDAWIGKSVLIEVKQVKAFGEIHDALRIKAKKLQADQSAPPPTTPAEPAPAPRAQTAPSKVKVAKDELWSLLTHVHQGADRRDAEAMKVAIEQVNEHLQGEGYMRTDETIGKLSLDRMEEIITLLKQAEEL